MGWKEQYERGKARLLTDESICTDNRETFGQFFLFEEHKLKRQNGLAALDSGCFKTLCSYVRMLKNANLWFGNRPWREITKDDIAKVYNDLEDGKIRNHRGVAYEDRRSYYNKVFRSKPFQMVGKADMAREVIEFTTPHRHAVRFVTEDTFKSIVSVIANPKYLMLLWLAWDIGENVDSLLRLSRRDFVCQTNRFTGEREYVVCLPQTKIKRSRQSRCEPTLYPETVRYIDLVFQTGTDDDIFGFGYAQARKFLRIAVRKSGARTEPDHEPVRWKDLRSGMACHLLKSGWSRDEVNARLGHTPHSSAIDAYINFMALDRQESKQKLHQGKVAALQSELAGARQAATIAAEHARRQEEINVTLVNELRQLRNDLAFVRKQVESLLIRDSAHG